MRVRRREAVASSTSWLGKWGGVGMLVGVETPYRGKEGRVVGDLSRPPGSAQTRTTQPSL